MRLFKLASVVLYGCLLATSASAATQFITNTPAPGTAPPPYSAATVAGDFIYVTGNVGAGEGIEARTTDTLNRIEATLRKAGADLSDVVNTRVYLTHAEDGPGMEKAYAAKFTRNPPARTVVVTGSLVGGTRGVEINAIAVRKGIAHASVIPAGWQKPAGAYSYAQKIGNTLYISGMTARNHANNSAAPSGIEAQTRVVMDNIGAVLKAAGMSYESLVNGRVFIKDIIGNYQGMNEAYRGYFKKDLPARATLEFTMVDPAELVTITTVAVHGGTRKVIGGSFDDAGKQRDPNPNFSAGIGTTDRMWVTGMTGQIDANKGDPGAQAELALQRMLKVLEAGGFTKEQVVEVNCYLQDAADRSNFQKMNEGYRRVFQKDLPARTTLQGKNRGGAAVEITIMAAR